MHYHSCVLAEVLRPYVQVRNQVGSKISDLALSRDLILVNRLVIAMDYLLVPALQLQSSCSHFWLLRVVTLSHSSTGEVMTLFKIRDDSRVHWTPSQAFLSQCVDGVEPDEVWNLPLRGGIC